MTDDDLRAALAAADPARSADLDPLTSPRARELLERAMTSDPSTDSSTSPQVERTRSRRPWLAAAAAAVVLTGAGGAWLAYGSDPADQPSGEQLVLAVPEGDPLTMSCLPVSAEVLAGLPLALAGKVSSVNAAEVRLDVTRWYRGGPESTVVLRNADERLQALLGTPDFQVGQDYLVSASDGSISVCGLTGPASPELQAAYDEAFGG